MAALLEIEEMSTGYAGVPVVRGLNLHVDEGEVVALLGPNGAGKTTTIRMLTTLLQPTSGTLLVDGLDPVSQQTDVRRQFGVVFQDPSLDQDLTAWENMDIHGVLYHVPRKVRRESFAMRERVS